MSRLLLCLFGVFSWAHATSQPVPDKIFNGREYIITGALVSGTPFFNNAENSENNTLRFDEVVYQGLPLLYDIKTDQLVTRRPGELTNMIIVKEMVDFFTIGKDTLLHLKEASTGLADGFYLQVFNSPAYKSVARYKKAVRDPRAINEKRYYFETVEYFLKTPDSEKFLPVKNIRTLLSVDKQYKKNLKSLLRTHGNREDFPGSVALVLDYLNKTNRASL